MDLLLDLFLKCSRYDEAIIPQNDSVLDSELISVATIRS